MLGAVHPPQELGAIPCAISWLYKGINERRQKNGARFSVRVSALGVSAHKPESASKDLLAAHATGKNILQKRKSRLFLSRAYFDKLLYYVATNLQLTYFLL